MKKAEPDLERDRKRLEETYKIIKPYLNGGKLLDVGCGEKMLKGMVERDGIQYMGVDYPEADFEKKWLPWKDSTFDYVTCFEVMEHLKTQDNIIKELKRVVKSNGFIFISLPSYHVYYRMLMMLGIPFDHSFEFNPRMKHYHFPTVGQCKDFIGENFKVVAVRHIGIPAFLANKMPRWLSYCNVFVCKKGFCG